MYSLQLFVCLLSFFNDFGYGYGHIRTHDAAGCAKNTVSGTGLIRREIAHRIHFIGQLQNILRTNGHT
jgi:hypothetical protein